MDKKTKQNKKRVNLYDSPVFYQIHTTLCYHTHFLLPIFNAGLSHSFA